MLVAPSRKNLAFTFGPNVDSGDLHDIRHAKPPQLANLPCARILVREPPADELVVLSTRRVAKNRNSRRDAALHEVRRLERPAPAESIDTTMMSAGATGSLTTSAHPAARRAGSRTEGTAKMAAAANATTTRIGAHLGRREIMLGFISKFHVRDACGNAATPRPVMKSRPPILILPLISFQPVLYRNAMEPLLAKNLLAQLLPELAHRRRFAFIYLMTAVFQNAIFQDKDAARRALDLICDSRCGTDPSDVFKDDHARTPRGGGKVDGAPYEVAALNLAAQTLAALKSAAVAWDEGRSARPRSSRSRTRTASRCSPRASTCAWNPPCSRRRCSSRPDHGYSISIGEAPRHVCSKANRGLIFRGSSAPTYSAPGGIQRGRQ